MLFLCLLGSRRYSRILRVFLLLFRFPCCFLLCLVVIIRDVGMRKQLPGRVSGL